MEIRVDPTPTISEWEDDTTAIIDTHIRAMHARAETIALETDDPDAVTIAHHIGRAVNRIGYR